MQYYDLSMKPVGGMGGSGGKSLYKKPKFALQSCQYATYDQVFIYINTHIDRVVIK